MERRAGPLSTKGERGRPANDFKEVMIVHLIKHPKGRALRDSVPRARAASDSSYLRSSLRQENEPRANQGPEHEVRKDQPYK